MIPDAFLKLSDNQTLVASPLSAVTTNYIDLSLLRDIGMGQQLYAVITIRTSATVGAGLGVRWSLKLSTDTTPETPTLSHYSQPTLAQTGLYTGTALTAGTQITMVINPLTAASAEPVADPSTGITGLQYVYGWVECVSGIDGVTPGNVTAGTFDFDITLHPGIGGYTLPDGTKVGQNKSYRSGFSIL